MLRNTCVVTLLFLVFVAGQDIVPDDPEVQKEMHKMFYKARAACADEHLVPYGKLKA